ncbi:MAG: tRNA pseudouridine(55) synthase TruB [Desulfomonile sp.]|nr:tRNA pseudouridine(55) synthase TruB [Desulfomonile sp.]
MPARLQQDTETQLPSGCDGYNLNAFGGLTSTSPMHGILLVDKPEGITSNDVVRLVKKFVKPAKVGHSGTLDPAASGLVVVLIGAATRALDYLDESCKHYRMTVFLGEETDTDDREGTVTRTGDASHLTIGRIEETLGKYIGVIDQVPPRYSAIKKNGVPLYKLAREGAAFEVPARKVEIFSLTATKWEPPLLDLDLLCSKGTYARALARDLGRDLGVGGRLESLRRLASGPFRIENAIGTRQIKEDGRSAVTANLIRLADGLGHIPELQAFPNEIRRLMRGTPVVLSRARFMATEAFNDRRSRLLKIVSGEGDLVILVRPEPRGPDLAVLPVRLFKTWDEAE